MVESDRDPAAPERSTRKGEIPVALAAFASTLMVELADGWPAGLPQGLLLVGGAALIGLVAGGAVLRTFRWILGPRRMLTLLSAGLTLALVYVTGPAVLQFFRHAIFGCAPATELTVLTTPSGLSPSTQLIDRYEQWTAERNGGCATVNAYVYAAADSDVRAAISQGWELDGGQEGETPEAPLRDIGPQPDAWLADSSAEVNLLDEQVRRDRVARNDVVAYSPVVLGVPEAAAAGLPPDGLSWPALFGQLVTSGIGVVRPDPQVSVVGRLATAALYGHAVDRSGATAGQPELEPSAVEQWIGRSLDQEDYPLADSPELLCRHRQLPASQVAVILSEQDLVRFNQGSPLGGACGAEDYARASGERMIAFYPRTVALDHRFVEFTWTPPSSRRAEKVAELRDWLTEERGHQALEEVGLRPPNAPLKSSLFAEQGARTNAAFDTVDIDADRLRDVTIPALLEAQRRSRVLLVLDVSGSMAAPAPPGTGTRLSAVTKAIRSALPSVRPPDELGLWLFPGDPSGRTINRVVAVGPPDEARTQAVSDTLAAATPEGNTPLFRAVIDGVDALGPSDATTASKLVVITDGEDTTSGLTPDQVLAGVRDGDVRVFVIAVGEISCAAAPLQSLADETGGTCHTAAPSEVSSLLSGIITSSGAV